MWGIDYFTKWTEAESLATITSAKCEDLFWKNVVCRFGVPRALVVDNGKQFDNNNFRTFCTNLSIDLRFTSVAHPQSNRLKKKLDEAKGAWVDELPKVLWAYRTTPHSVTGETPFFLCYGTEALLPVEIGVPTIRALHFNKVNNEDELRANLDLNSLSRRRYHSRQNEVIQGDIRKALDEHLLRLREAKLVNLKAVIRTILEPFIPNISIKEVTDALITSLLHLLCRSPLCPFQPPLQSLDLCKWRVRFCQSKIVPEHSARAECQTAKQNPVRTLCLSRMTTAEQNSVLTESCPNTLPEQSDNGQAEFSPNRIPSEHSALAK
ncbi:hypothetical protein RJ639_042011 [Escallonia herrerae]|uniref:Integrase catalytic domain-containing protein n=1 Tax=Escallonia herrerae TaxID=1293975 RepID=A0AA88WIF6_9ASTE|nr:hypothetical protein RJ639_042011 [Escallonia herrerae]